MSTTKKTVLITGCSDGGTGAALAIAFHNRKHDVWATTRDVSKMSHLRSLGIRTLELDVASAESISACVAQLPSLDILINNAGGSLNMPLADVSLPDARNLFELNVWAPLALTQACLPLLLRSKQPIVVNHTSVGSLVPIPFQAVYNASKAALAMLSDSLRLELAPFGVTVVDLKTGGVRTNFVQNARARSSALPENSIYAPAREAMEKALAQEGSQQRIQEKGMPAEQWAEGVAGDLLKQNPPAMIWRGEAAGLARVATLAPHGCFDPMAKSLTGLDVVEKIIREERKSQGSR